MLRFKTNMPLTSKGEEIMSSMKSEYGSKKGEEVFYASKNAGTIKGVDEMPNVPGLNINGIKAVPSTRNALVIQPEDT